MDVAFTQYVAHGTGGNLNRWLDDVQFGFQQVVSSLGGDEYDMLVVELMLPGRSDFGDADIAVEPNRRNREIRSTVVFDASEYGSLTNARDRIIAIIEGLEQLTSVLCDRLDKSDVAEVYRGRVAGLADSLF